MIQFTAYYFESDQEKQLGKDIPCNHPGCCSHVSHPCEICGRIACGLIDRPATAEEIKEAVEG